MAGCIPPLSKGRYAVDVIRADGTIRCQLSGVKIDGSFTRTIDGTSRHELTITSGGCCDCVPAPRSDLIRITRVGTREMWEGPVLRLFDDQDRGVLSVEASDLSYWWQGTPVTAAFAAKVKAASNSDGLIDPVVFADMILDEFDRYHATGIRRPARPALHGTLIRPVLEPDTSLWDEFDSLADGLIDWTVIGRDLYWGAIDINLADGPLLTKSVSWLAGSLGVDQDGSQVTTRVVVIGADGIRGSHPAAENEQDLGFGRRTVFVTDDTVDNVEEANAKAKFYFESNRLPSNFLVTGTGSLGEKAPVCLSDLIPGRIFPVAADSGCLNTTERQRLHNVVVSFRSVSGCDGWELVEDSVAVDLSPVGSVGTASRVSV